VGIYDGKKQVAFGRVITDYCTFAYLCDVFVEEGFRGRGLSKWMMDRISDHPELRDLRRFPEFDSRRNASTEKLDHFDHLTFQVEKV
jgi:GNAT superfamily N-acetyltransferase